MLASKGPRTPSAGPEWRLVLESVRAYARREAPDTDPGTEGVDWRLFLELVRHHAVLPLVHRHLTTRPRSETPGAVLAEVERLYLLNVGTSHGLARRLLEVLALLAEEGIDAIPFKGPTLAVKAYGDLSLRPFSDLDVFVPPAAAERARAVLTGHGFVLSGDAADPPWLSPTQYHYTMTEPASGLSVELHWGIAPGFLAFPMSDPRWWRAEARVELLGQAVPQFESEDQLLMLCVHGSKHVWGRLAWICDVALLASREALDWDAVSSRARNLGAGRMLNLGLVLAHGLLAATLPDAVVELSYRDRAAVRLAHRALELMRKDAEPRDVNLPDFFLRLQERRADWLRLLVYLVRGKLGRSERAGVSPLAGQRTPTR